MTNHAAVVAAFHVPAQQRRATGDDRSPRLLLDGGQNVRVKIGRAVNAQNIGQTRTVGHGSG